MCRKLARAVCRIIEYGSSSTWNDAGFSGSGVRVRLGEAGRAPDDGGRSRFSARVLVEKQRGAVGRESERSRSRREIEPGYLTVGRQVPQPHSLIGTGRSKGFSVRRHIQRNNATAMTRQCGYLFPLCHIPQFDELVGIPAHQGAPIWRKDNVRYETMMTR